MSDQAALKQTPLNATHRELGARMVDFGGWDMPVNYGSQIEEHHAVRSGCGLFDVSHMLPLDIRGANVRAFLRRLVANNVDKLQVSGKALYSCMLNEAGGVIDDLIIYFMDENWFRLVVNAGTAEKDLAWMAKMNADWGMGLTLTPRRDLAMIAIQGPKATQALNEALPGVDQITASLKPFNAAAMGEMFIARTGYTGEDGFEVMVLAKAAPFFWIVVPPTAAVSSRTPEGSMHRIRCPVTPNNCTTPSTGRSNRPVTASIRAAASAPSIASPLASISTCSGTVMAMKDLPGPCRCGGGGCASTA
jgi:aminomethyltransferase